jgi:hypothetical protein
LSFYFSCRRSMQASVSPICPSHEYHWFALLTFESRCRGVPMRSHKCSMQILASKKICFCQQTVCSLGACLHADGQGYDRHNCSFSVLQQPAVSNFDLMRFIPVSFEWQKRSLLHLELSS